MTFKYPLATTSWDERELAAVRKVIDSGVFTMGSHVAEFEHRFADWQGSRYAVMVNSGSSANLLMTATLFFTQDETKRLKPGDEIIVPAISWPTTYYPLAQYGLRQTFVDIDLNTLNYDVRALRDAVTDQTRAIMAVNLLGNPNDFAAIREIVGERDIVLLEDNCESMGAVFGGKKTGSFGLMGTFSGFFSHHISTMEGGVVVTDDEELHHILLCLRSHGWTRNLPKHNRVTGTKSDSAFEESFHFVLPGYNVRPLEISGAAGVAQVEKLPHIIKERRANGRYLQERLADHPVFLIQTEIGESSWFGFSLVIREGVGVDRRSVVDWMTGRGFEVRPVVAGNFTRNPVLRHMPHRLHGNLAAADYVAANGLFFGNHQHPIRGAIDEIASFR
jgi:CDP-6-deoxy-D-xylo-4-hexulose-3-dehydrase